jgi:ubiquitin-conjugating enzyme E2 variant
MKVALGSAAWLASCPGWCAAAAAALCCSAWVAADLVVGFFHFWVDNYGSETTPGIGGLIAAFQEHHHQPWLITRGQMCTVVDGPCVVTAPMVLLPLLVAGPAWCAFWGFYAAWSVTAQLTHKWSHERRACLHPLVGALQDAHVFISCREHRRHHAQPINDTYCILSGLWNAPLHALRVWPAIEKAVYAATGAMPRSWAGRLPDGVKTRTEAATAPSGEPTSRCIGDA